MAIFQQSEVVQSTPEEIPQGEKSELSSQEEAVFKWPQLDPAALIGFAGKFVPIATQKTEADPPAVLLTLLSRFAIECGSNPYLMIGDSRHFARIYVAIVGKTSRARKGTSAQPVKRLFKLWKLENNKSYIAARTSPGPLSTGEGLISETRDEKIEWDDKKKVEVIRDNGVDDKRLFVLDEEFASALSCTKREGNTLSTILRSAWDHGDLEPLTKTFKIKATGAHIGIVTHITIEELNKKLDETEAFNGFANRFLWCCSRRPKEVPLPKAISPEILNNMRYEIMCILELTKNMEEMKLSQEAIDLWVSTYASLTKEKSGLLGSVTSRAEAQVIRLSMIYALLDGQGIIEKAHLSAALALWDYCEASAEYIFGNRELDRNSRIILRALNEGPKTKTELHRVFDNKIKVSLLDEALSALINKGRIKEEKNGNGKKPVKRFSVFQKPVTGCR